MQPGLVYSGPLTAAEVMVREASEPSRSQHLCSCLMRPRLGSSVCAPAVHFGHMPMGPNQAEILSACLS